MCVHNACVHKIQCWLSATQNVVGSVVAALGGRVVACARVCARTRTCVCVLRARPNPHPLLHPHPSDRHQSLWHRRDQS